jgi:uncharacterized protein YhdP
MASGLIPLAVVVGLGRELVPLVSEQKPAIERLLSEKTGLVVRLGSISASWHGLTPSLKATTIELADPSAPSKTLLSIPSLTTEPDWLATLRDLSPRLRTHINGLSLTLAPNPEGGIRILELSGLGSSQPERARDSLRWLVAQPSLALVDSALVWQASGRSKLGIHDLTINQYSHGKDYRAQVQFKLKGKRDIQRGIIRVAGDPIAWQTAPWQLYLNIKNLKDWQPWTALFPAGWQFDLQAGHGELWLSGQGGKPQQATMSVQAVSMRARWPKANPYVLSDLHGVFMAQGEPALGRLAFSNVQGRLDGLAIPMQRGHVSWQPDTLNIELAGLSLTDAYALAKREALIPASLAPMLQRLNPTGFLPRLHIAAIRRDQRWALSSANAEFKALSWQAYKAFPGVSNMAGWLQASDSKGLVYLDTRRASINAPEVFRDAIAADSLRGGVRWYRHQEQWHIDTGMLRLDNADAKTSVQLALQLPINDPGAGRLDLLAGLYDGQVASAWRYIPWHSAGDKTLGWLRRALIAGQVSNGSFAYSGALRHGRPDSGQLDVSLQVANATLDYVPGWPVISQLNAQVDMHGRDLSITADSGRILDATVSHMLARIPELDKPVLGVDADLAFDLADLDRLLAESPLKVKTAEVAKQLDMRGAAKANLQLSIPFVTHQPAVKVDVSVEQAELGLADSPLQFTDVQGQVAFDDSRGLTGQLHGKLWNEAAQIDLAGEKRADRWRAQAIKVQAPVTALSLSRWTGSDLTAYIDGRTPVVVDLDIPIAQPGAVGLRVNSSLQGMAIKLPVPLAKPASRVAALKYQGKLGAGNQLARATIDGIAQAGLTWRDKQLTRLLVRVGLPGLAWSEEPGISVEASLGSVQLNDWQEFVAKTPTKTTTNKVLQALPTFQRLNLQTKALLAGDEGFGPVALSLRRDKADWLVSADHLQPSALPKWPSTSLEARVKQQDSGWLLEPLRLIQTNADFNGKLSWRTGARVSSQLAGELDTRSTAALLTQLGLTAGLESRSGKVTADLAWPGYPSDFVLAQASGTLSASFKSGRLVGIDRINPLARVLGLVNASNLLRRLRFDFSDVTRKGLSFDELNLSGELSRGVLNPANIDLEGPSLSLRGRGSVNVITHEVNQRVRVDIPVSSAVPVVAGFLAGPVVGGALVAADLLLDKQLARLTSMRYRLSGPWENLQIDNEALLKSDDDKSTDSKAQE